MIIPSSAIIKHKGTELAHEERQQTQTDRSQKYPEKHEGKSR